MSVREALPIKMRVCNFLIEAQVGNALVLRYHIKNGKDESIYHKHEMVRHRKRGLLFTFNYFFDISGKERFEHFLGDLPGNIGATKRIKPISWREGEVVIIYFPT